MSNKIRITKKSISIMGGICFILLALVTFFSINTPFAFLSKLITDTFGFVGFYAILPYIAIVGVYIIVKKKLLRFKVGLSLWGLAIMILCFLILSSNWASVGVEYNGIKLVGTPTTIDDEPRYLIFSNAKGVFDVIKTNIAPGIGADPSLGGGIFGFILAGAINSAITPIGLNIVCWVFFVGGLIMVFNHQVTALVRFIKFKAKNRTYKKQHHYNQITIGEAEEEYVAPITRDAIVEKKEEKPKVEEQKTIIPQAPIVESFKTTPPPVMNERDLRRAHFEFSNEQVIENSLCKRIGATEFIETTNMKKEEVKEPTFDELYEQEEKLVAPTFEEPVTEESSKEEAPIVAPEKPVVQAPKEPEPVIEEPVQEPAIEEVPEVDELHRPQPKAELLPNYIYPSLDLLELKESDDDKELNEQASIERTQLINDKLNELRIGAQVIGHTVGPSVTRFDVRMNPGVTVNTIQRFVNDIGSALFGLNVRYLPIVAGKSTSGLEVENKKRTVVGIRESISGLPSGEKNTMVIPFGRNISNELVYANAAEFPHLLVAGTTGSGKSIFMHGLILTLIMRNRPDELKVVLVDPKKVEMNYYKNIPHLLCPNISDPKQAYVAFMKLVDEMERRFNLFQDSNTRDIKEFNEYAKEKGLQPLPRILAVIDEFADLMETCKEIHEPVVRISQKARAAGIHLVIATQRPSVNVIDGVIKSNISSRVALMSASYVDSNTIIGEGGAESLLGNGDMLVDTPLLSRSEKPRIQGCYVTGREITRVCDFLREHYQPQFDPNFLDLTPKQAAPKQSEPTISRAELKEQDDEKLYQIIKEDVVNKEYVSISYLVRAYSMGFSKAGKMIKRLQDDGIVDTLTVNAKGNKVLVHEAQTQVDSLEQSTFIPEDNQ